MVFSITFSATVCYDCALHDDTMVSMEQPHEEESSCECDCHEEETIAQEAENILSPRTAPLFLVFQTYTIVNSSELSQTDQPIRSPLSISLEHNPALPNVLRI
jgi:hypothetical protein